jgi:hypothetical protein
LFVRAVPWLPSRPRPRMVVDGGRWLWRRPWTTRKPAPTDCRREQTPAVFHAPFSPGCPLRRLSVPQTCAGGFVSAPWLNNNGTAVCAGSVSVRGCAAAPVAQAGGRQSCLRALPRCRKTCRCSRRCSGAVAHPARTQQFDLAGIFNWLPMDLLKQRKRRFRPPDQPAPTASTNRSAGRHPGVHALSMAASWWRCTPRI